MLFPSFKALCTFSHPDVITKLRKHTHVPSSKVYMEVVNKTGPRTNSWGCPRPLEKPSQIDRKLLLHLEKIF